MLLVIDMQEKYMKNYPDSLINSVNARIKEAQEKKEEIVYVMNIGKEENRDGYNLADDLYIFTDRIYEKNKPSAFSAEDFTEFLSHSWDRKLEIIGIDGNCCVKKTAIDAVKEGFEVFINSNCVEVRNIKIYEKTLVEFEKNKITVI